MLTTTEYTAAQVAVLIREENLAAFTLVWRFRLAS